MLTKEVTDKYKVTRQTVNNWINDGIITKPCKGKNNKFIWTNKEIKELEAALNYKNKKKDFNNYFEVNNRRYLGSKHKLLNFIDEVFTENTKNVNSVADIFAGTGVVAEHFNKKGNQVIVNGLLYSNYLSYLTWFGNDKINESKIHRIIDTFNLVEGYSGYITKNFGDKYFTKENAMILDEVREKIEGLKDKVNPREYSFLMTSLLYAMDKSANTVGHYDAYRKTMTNTKKIEFKYPIYNKNNQDNLIFNMDANELAKTLYADLVYIDTPYNSRGYENAYHVLENVAEWKKLDVEGVASKAVNRSEKSSEYNRKNAPFALDNLILNLDCRYILLSYNNMAKKGNSRSNAKISNDEIIETLSKRGEVKAPSTDYNAFTTGKSSVEDHKELLYPREVRK